MMDVIIYTKDYCPYCRRAIALLKQKNASFDEIDVTYDEEAFAKIKAQTGSDTVPQIFIRGEFIGGCDDLFALEEKGILEDRLSTK
ncbi:glutaredoxin 3 [Natronincola peptidivorans]|uniref:Glutaredoxin n=1 Tax=Natronincola peptidivorans TaxID=426128 RepID=A0A1I0GHC6_9FIRM|nr:glutaredoxin 3 [Natronincola peptidivorans]SET70280.1 glutaredoxin 3 [Natronincola peptidivorans]